MSKQSKSRLGRGLSSLISVGDPDATPAPATPGTAETAGAGLAAPVHVDIARQSPAPPRAGAQELPVADIHPNPHQPRRNFDEASLAELAASLKTNGLIQPVIVRQVGGAYQLIAGERRLRAAKLAGLTTIPALVRDVDSFTQAQMALVENIQREDLNPIDRAHGYRALLSQLGLTQAELAARLGEDRSSIANYLRLLDLAEPVRQLVQQGMLSMGHAKLLAGVPDLLEQERVANLVTAQGLSVRNLERMIQGQGGPPAPRRSNHPSAHLADLEKSLGRQLGMRVQLRAGANKQKGRLVIHYASLDQFDDLLGRLGVRAEG